MTDNEMIDKAVSAVFAPILVFLKMVVGFIFSNGIITFLFYFIFINFIAIILMKRDKTYAENEQRRIKESTLMLVALVGGSLGMYYAMFKYKHKTLHTKFVVGVPAIICFQSAFISCMLVTKIIAV